MPGGGRGSSDRRGGPGRGGLGGTRRHLQMPRAMAARAARTILPVLGLRPRSGSGEQGQGTDFNPVRQKTERHSLLSKETAQ